MIQQQKEEMKRVKVEYKKLARRRAKKKQKNIHEKRGRRISKSQVMMGVR